MTDRTLQNFVNGKFADAGDGRAMRRKPRDVAPRAYRAAAPVSRGATHLRCAPSIAPRRLSRPRRALHRFASVVNLSKGYLMVRLNEYTNHQT